MSVDGQPSALLWCLRLGGYGQEENVRQAVEAAVDHYLVKPADPSALPDPLAARERGRDDDMSAI